MASVPPGHECAAGDLHFICNLCGEPCVWPLERLDREAASCTTCGSTLRFRSIVQVLSTTLFGKNLPLPQFPVSPYVRGLGLSDSAAYAAGLASRFDYVNTYFDSQPRLDICNPERAFLGSFDFVIASDVFEHIVPPVATAFQNLRALLRPNGVVVFTVPFSMDEHTAEHYPDLFDWQLLDEGNGKLVVENRTRDGRKQRFSNVVIHHGPGMTVEMRAFSQNALLREFAAAGFDRVTIESRPCFEHGIYWRDPWSVTMSARAPQ